MLSINTIARVIVNVVRPAASPTSWDTGLLLVKDAAFADAKRLRTYANSTEAATGMTADGFGPKPTRPRRNISRPRRVPDVCSSPAIRLRKHLLKPSMPCYS